MRNSYISYCLHLGAVVYTKVMKIVGPTISPQLSEGKAPLLTTEATLEKLHFAAEDLVGLQAKNLSLDEVILEKIIAVQAGLEKLQLSDVIAKGCDWSGANCADASMIRMALTNCRGVGWDLNKSVLKNVVFKDCKLDMANFRFAKLTQVRFVDCSLAETDFQAAKLEHVEFQNCIFDRTEFAQSTIKDVDLRTSQLLEIKGWQSLQGVTIDQTQLITVAPQLAAALGLKTD